MQFIPYASFRNFRAVDTRDPSQPRFNQIDARGKAGLDSKFVFHDSLVLDTTINPDFAQVESDEPKTQLISDSKSSFRRSALSFSRTQTSLGTPILECIASHSCCLQEESQTRPSARVSRESRARGTLVFSLLTTALPV